MRTPDPHRKLHEYMDKDIKDGPAYHSLVGRLSPSRSFSLFLFYLFGLFMLDNFN
jgi:hypothetical protein